MRSIHSAYNEFVEYPYIQKHTQLSTYKCILHSMHTINVLCIQTTFLRQRILTHTSTLWTVHIHINTHTYKPGEAEQMPPLHERTCMCLYVLVCEQLHTPAYSAILTQNDKCTYNNILANTTTYKHILASSYIAAPQGSRQARYSLIVVEC